MEILTKVVDSVKNDVNQLKDQMGQILEALTAMKSIKESPVVKNEEATSFNPVVQQIGMVPVPRLDHTRWPPYGVPPNYTPPYEAQLEQEQPAPLISVNPSGTPTNQSESVYMQQNVCITGTNVDSTVVPIATQPIVQPRVSQGISQDVEEAKIKLELLEERFRAIEGGGSFGFGNAAELCLVSDLVIPPKFKAPKFDKYKGASCPKNHLTMYCRNDGRRPKQGLIIRSMTKHIEAQEESKGTNRHQDADNLSISGKL